MAICSMQIDGHQVYFNAKRVGRRVSIDVYKIANPPDVDPQSVYAQFKAAAADLFQADVTSARYDAQDNPAVVEEAQSAPSFVEAQPESQAQTG